MLSAYPLDVNPDEQVSLTMPVPLQSWLANRFAAGHVTVAPLTSGHTDRPLSQYFKEFVKISLYIFQKLVIGPGTL
jgi:hypothetical protein